jgi:hypothetical protein
VLECKGRAEKRRAYWPDIVLVALGVGRMSLNRAQVDGWGR